MLYAFIYRVTRVEADQFLMCLLGITVVGLLAFNGLLSVVGLIAYKVDQVNTRLLYVVRALLLLALALSADA